MRQIVVGVGTKVQTVSGDGRFLKILPFLLMVILIINVALQKFIQSNCYKRRNRKTENDTLMTHQR